MLDPEHFASPGEAGLHFIYHQQNPMAVTQSAQSLHQFSRRLDKAAFTLHGLQHNRGGPLGLDVGAEQHVDGAQAVLHGYAERRMRERNMVNFSRERAEFLLVRQHLTGHRHRQHRAAVVAASKGDNAGTPGGGASDLHGVFQSFGAGREKDRLGRTFNGGQCVQPLGQRDVALIRRDLEARMRKARKLFSDGGHHLGMAMPSVQHRDAASKIDISLAFNVPEFGVFSALRENRVRIANATGNGSLTACHQLTVCTHFRLTPFKATTA